MMPYVRMYEELTDAHDKVFNLIMEGTKTGEIGQRLWDVLKAIESAQNEIKTEAGDVAE